VNAAPDTTIATGSLARGRAFVALAAILWSLSGVLVKSNALASLDPLAIAFFRSLFAGLALLPFVPPRHWRFTPTLIGMSLVFAGTVGTYVLALRCTTAANVIFLQCSATVWTALFTALLLRERPDNRSLLGIACALPGVLVIIAFGHGGTATEWYGVALGLLSGVGYSLVTVGMRHLRFLQPVWLIVVCNLGGAAALALSLFVFQGVIPTPTTTQVLILVLFGVFQLAVPYILFAQGLRVVSAPEAGLITLIEPILNPIWVLLAQHEQPRPATIVGGLFLILGVAVRYLPFRLGKSQKSTKTPDQPEMLEPPGAG